MPVQDLQSAGPSAILRPFVRTYAQRAIRGDESVQSVCMPRVETILKFEFGTPLKVLTPLNELLATPSTVVVGAFGSSTVRELLEPGLSSFVIFFRPSGFSRLFGVPMASLTNAAHEGGGVLGRELHRLYQLLGESGSFAERVYHVDEALMSRLPRLSVESPMLMAADRILKAKGAVSIVDIARAFGWTTRHFERCFSKEVGFSPKLYTRVARFQSAIDLKLLDPRLSWCSIAHELYYHDQMHLVHDFRKLGGSAPSDILCLLGDSRPQAPSIAAAV